MLFLILALLCITVYASPSSSQQLIIDKENNTIMNPQNDQKQQYSCSLTPHQLARINFKQELSAKFLILHFPQTSGFTLEEIATNLSTDISTTFTTTLLDPAQICIFSSTIDPTTFSSVIELVILPDYINTNSGKNPTVIKDTIYSSLQDPNHQLFTDSTYLKHVDLTHSTNPNTILTLYPCKNEASFFTKTNFASLCTDSSNSGSENDVDESLNQLSIILCCVTLFIMLLSTSVFWCAFTKHENRSDYQHRLRIKQQEKIVSTAQSLDRQASLIRQQTVNVSTISNNN
eukprot:UN04624